MNDLVSGNPESLDADSAITQEYENFDDFAQRSSHGITEFAVGLAQITGLLSA